MRDVLLILYNVPWQRLRVSTLKKYQQPSIGGWTSLNGTEQNIARLEEYLGSTEDEKEKYIRTWRVLNMLDAIRMGNHGQQTQLTAHDRRVIAYAREIRTEHQRFKAKYGNITLQMAGFDSFQDFENAIRRQLRVVPANDGLLYGVYENLHDRQKRHAERPELNWFLDLLRKEVKWLPSSSIPA